MSLAFLNIGVATLLLGTVAIWRRMPGLGLTTRSRALIWVASGIAMIAMAFVMDVE